MLRVGLTGDLGSGKSTVAAMLAARGAVVLSSDEAARAMMQPGEAVYQSIVAHFGREVVAADGTLDRRKLAAIAFDPASPRVVELNAIVHPRVLAEQAKQVAMFTGTDKIVVVESALIFSAYGQTEAERRERFDRILLVIAPDEAKISRFVERVAGGRALSAEERAAVEADARRRLALQGTESHAAECLVVRNDGSLNALEAQVDKVWLDLISTPHPSPR
ncbi:dephospho-CoA kinase [Granulicella sp. 5B5]|uniref:dephospho-CoA kinase n=1 Tax=Granulicella sp. 5B5 TaxID=1617967 RepID=UPI0015F482CA|nr:dephospho-CoA kinase [Granulicella sp. 5B5]QMV19323.1 dephospho-CoA kinase [Granulicella sp. 5B5]